MLPTFFLLGVHMRYQLLVTQYEPQNNHQHEIATQGCGGQRKVNKQSPQSSNGNA